MFEDVLHELGQSAVFSKTGVLYGFWHVQLDEESVATDGCNSHLALQS